MYVININKRFYKEKKKNRFARNTMYLALAFGFHVIQPGNFTVALNNTMFLFYFYFLVVLDLTKIYIKAHKPLSVNLNH